MTAPPPPGYSPPPLGGYPPPPPGGDPWSPRSPSGRWLSPPKEAYTPWSTRVLAFLIDWAPYLILGIGLPYLIVLIADGAECADAFLDDKAALCASTEASYLALLGFLIPFAYFFWNFCYRQGKTGQSIGKSVMKFKVISEATGQPIGFWRSFLRQIAHLVDQIICNIGYLLPLWDGQRQTIADKIMSTVCVPLKSPLIIPPHSEGANWDEARWRQDAELRAVKPEEPSAVQLPRWFSRFSSQAQGWISAALLAPPLLIKVFGTQVIRPSLTREEWGIVWDFYTIAYGLYFLAVIAVVTRYRARLVPALSLGGAVVFLDIVLTLGPDMSWFANFVLFGVIVIGYVAAWGIARRQHHQWLWGLLVSAVACTAFRFLLYSSPIGGSLFLLAKWELTFLTGCLICLAFDVAASRRMTTAQPPNGETHSNLARSD